MRARPGEQSPPSPCPAPGGSPTLGLRSINQLSVPAPGVREAPPSPPRLAVAQPAVCAPSPRTRTPRCLPPRRVGGLTFLGVGFSLRGPSPSLFSHTGVRPADQLPGQSTQACPPPPVHGRGPGHWWMHTGLSGHCCGACRPRPGLLGLSVKFSFPQPSSSPALTRLRVLHSCHCLRTPAPPRALPTSCIRFRRPVLLECRALTLAGHPEAVSSPFLRPALARAHGCRPAIPAAQRLCPRLGGSQCPVPVGCFSDRTKGQMPPIQSSLLVSRHCRGAGGGTSSAGGGSISPSVRPSSGLAPGLAWSLRTGQGALLA